MFFPHDPYPPHAAGSIIAAAAIEHSDNTSTAPEITTIAAMTSAAAAVQDLYDVQRPDLPPTPIAILSFICVESGEGKSLGAKVYVEPHERMQMHLDEQAQDPHEFEASRLLWKEELDFKRAEVRRLLNEKMPTDQAKAAIAVHLRNEPKKPQSVPLLYNEPTPTGLRRGLATWPSGFLVTMDGGSLLNGPLGKQFDFMDAVWDGDTIRSATADKSLTAYSPRLSALIYTQPLPTHRYFKRRGEEALATGFLARGEWAFLPSSKATQAPRLGPTKNEAVAAFQARAFHFLEEGVRSRKSGNKARRPIGFTADAAAYFRDLRQRTVTMSAPGRELQGLGGYAAKLAERVTRYACIIHVFNDLPGLIGAETLSNAERIVQWHTRQFVRMLMETSPHTQAQYDAQYLEQLILQAAHRGEMIRLADLSRIAPPNWGRPRRIQAWQMLQHSGRACLRHWRRAQYIQLASMPHFLTALEAQREEQSRNK